MKMKGKVKQMSKLNTTIDKLINELLNRTKADQEQLQVHLETLYLDDADTIKVNEILDAGPIKRGRHYYRVGFTDQSYLGEDDSRARIINFMKSRATSRGMRPCINALGLPMRFITGDVTWTAMTVRWRVVKIYNAADYLIDTWVAERIPLAEERAKRMKLRAEFHATIDKLFSLYDERAERDNYDNTLWYPAVMGTIIDAIVQMVKSVTSGVMASYLEDALIVFLETSMLLMTVNDYDFAKLTATANKRQAEDSMAIMWLAREFILAQDAADNNPLPTSKPYETRDLWQVRPYDLHGRETADIDDMLFNTHQEAVEFVMSRGSREFVLVRKTVVQK